MLIDNVILDPGTAVLKSTGSLIPMTPIDISLARITFTAPTSGSVVVRIRGTIFGGVSLPGIFFGVMEGSTIRLRMVPTTTISGRTTDYGNCEMVGIVSGLTPGNSYTWDAAYGVDVLVTGTNLAYGGPNDSAGADAYGALEYEIWDATNLLASKVYDPPGLVSKSVAGALTPMAAFDVSALRNTFTVPTSGKVLWRVHCVQAGAGAPGAVLLGVMESTTVIARCAPTLALIGASGSTGKLVLDASGTIKGLTPGSSHTWDAAFATQVLAGAGSALKYGGPDDSITNNAQGAILFSIWSA